jgi:hypothetical protein
MIVIVTCLFTLRIVDSSHLKISASKQWANIKCCVLLHESPSDMLRMLEEVYGKVARKKAQVYEWYKRFLNRYETPGIFCMETHLSIGRWCARSLTKHNATVLEHSP